jgi:hypothetical protein
LDGFKRIFPPKRIQRSWQRIEPRHYPRKLQPSALIKALMLAFILELPGIREITERFFFLLHSRNFSTLTFALRNLAMLMIAQQLIRQFSLQCPPATSGHLVVIDAMPMTLTEGRGHNCRQLNPKTRGGGILWAVWLKPPPGACPLSQLSLMRGAWSDIKLLRMARLTSAGPTYLLDRGFFAIDLVDRWLKRGVHFIQRAPLDQVFVEKTEKICGPSRMVGQVWVQRDEIGLLGVENRRGPRPRIRLVWGVLPSGDAIILISDHLEWGAQRLLQAYKQRHHVECFHRRIKQLLGLAHLYSFHPVGIELQLEVAVLLVLLTCLMLADLPCRHYLLELLDWALQSMRRNAGLPATRWRPNTPQGHRHAKETKGGEAIVMPNH